MRPEFVEKIRLIARIYRDDAESASRLLSEVLVEAIDDEERGAAKEANRHFAVVLSLTPDERLEVTRNLASQWPSVFAFLGLADEERIAGNREAERRALQDALALSTVGRLSDEIRDRLSRLSN